PVHPSSRANAFIWPLSAVVRALCWRTAGSALHSALLDTAVRGSRRVPGGLSRAPAGRPRSEFPNTRYAFVATNRDSKPEECMQTTERATHLPPLGGAVREEVTIVLQQALVELIDLGLVGKQLHWTVVGELFRPLHEELDELVDSWR